MNTNKNTKILFVFASLSMLLSACGQTPTSSDGGNSSIDNSSINSSNSSVGPQINPWVDTYPRNEITLDVNDFNIGADPYGFNVTYYSDIYSRGFSYLTDDQTSGTELYIVKSEEGENADFNVQPIEGDCNLVTYKGDGIDTDIAGFSKQSGYGDQLLVNSHRVQVENLDKDTVYSYKVGSNDHFVYGVFKTEVETPKTIKVMELSDAQTKDHTKLDVFRNTFMNGRKTGGTDLDFIINGGDQFDQNMGKVNSKTIAKILRYGKAYDAIKDWKTSIPYLSASGNHEPTSPYSQILMNNMKYAGFTKKGGWYSFDYNFAHFVILNSNEESKTEQLTWLEEDLKNSTAQWKIVMTHAGCFTTGDHGSKNDNKSVTEKFAPIFSKYHVDLVLQAHEHTYNKTLPYKWDAAGYSETAGDTAVVNFSPATEVKEGVTYDFEPKGTYYVTTGSAGHRCGEAEADAGIYAEVIEDAGSWKALNSSQTYLNTKYKVENGMITENNQYTAYAYGGFTSSQTFNAGHLATGNVNANMFGILELTETTLSYKFYTSLNSDVKLFDTLNVLKVANTKF